MNSPSYALDPWQALRFRRVATIAAAVAFIPFIIFAPPGVGLALAFGCVIIAVAAVRAYRCPRCHERFAGAGLRSWPDECACCGLTEYATPTDVSAPVAFYSAAADRIAPGLRRWIAYGEMASGIGATLLSAFYAARLPWWEVSLLEGIGVLGVYAGWYLRKDQPEGYRVTRMLQWLSLLKVQGGYGAYAISCGFELNLVFAPEGFHINPGIWATVTVLRGIFRNRIEVNMLAAFLLVALWGAQSGRRVSQRARVSFAPPSPTDITTNRLTNAAADKGGMD